MPSITVAANRKGGPSEVFSVFLAMGFWKNMVIFLLGGSLVISLLLNLHLQLRDPDVVVIDQNGKASYLKRGVVSDELLSFIRSKKELPGVKEAIQFSEWWIGLLHGVNSVTVAEGIADALSFTTDDFHKALLAKISKMCIIKEIKKANITCRVKFDKSVVTDDSSNGYRINSVGVLEVYSNKNFMRNFKLKNNNAEDNFTEKPDKVLHFTSDIIVKATKRTDKFLNGLMVAYFDADFE